MGTRPQVPPGITGVEARVVKIDPGTAKVMLKHNVRNRGVRPITVNAYARDMAEGRWTLTGEAIKFDTNGHLADGQHRLEAVIKADVAVEFLVVWGVAPEAQDVMDSGMKRQAYDRYRMDGVKNPTIITSAARFALRREGRAQPTTGEVHEWVADNPAVHDAATAAGTLAQHIDVPKSVLAVAWLLLSDVDPHECGEFFDTLAHARTRGEGDPRYALLTRLRTVQRSKEVLNQEAYLSLVVRAWNAWRKGRNVRTLPVDSRVGAVRAPEPK